VEFFGELEKRAMRMTDSPVNDFEKLL